MCFISVTSFLLWVVASVGIIAIIVPMNGQQAVIAPIPLILYILNTCYTTLYKKKINFLARLSGFLRRSLDAPKMRGYIA